MSLNVKGPLMAKCGTCAFWKRQHKTQGICRARSPSVVMVGVQQPQGKLVGGRPQHPEPVLMTAFPQTTPDMWCGDWAPQGGLESAFVNAAREQANGQAEAETQAEA